MGQMAGTRPYMAPEVLRAASLEEARPNLHGRAAFALDAFNLGATVVEVLTGKPPEREATSHEVILRRPDADTADAVAERSLYDSAWEVA